MSTSASSPILRPFRDLPVLRRGGRWLLAACDSAVPADRALATELDRFAVAMAAADRAVAALPPQPGGR
ncbi:hypothetical protein [Streptomyces sp. NBC_01190]|uniref:hypothetical protein n=1 Tax=Streptomyces sp. NBC_01190 TaxID=2903767 RepID=UPI00386AD47D|nr:hypothetical protein OG519_28700 [Streptomyces sp. NBC_01190]